MRFDKTWMIQSLFQCAQNGIEPFHVADLQDEPLFSSHLCQVSGIAGLFGDRFQFHVRRDDTMLLLCPTESA